MSYWDYEPVRPPLIFESEKESQAFGISVVRANYSTWNGIDSELHAAMQKNDLVILRTRDVIPFDEIDGFTVIPDGAITYWASEVDPEFEAGDSGYHLELKLNESSLARFSEVLRDSFSDYKNHYDCNPALTGPSTSEAYLHWAMSRVDSGELTGLLTFHDEAIGVVSAVQKDGLVELEIAGITHKAQGNCHYKFLIGQLWKKVDQPNSSRLVISTQTENRNVQSAWQKIGLKPQFEVHTTHIMKKN